MYRKNIYQIKFEPLPMMHNDARMTKPHMLEFD